MLLSMCGEGSRTSKLLSMGVPKPETLRARLISTSETEAGCRRVVATMGAVAVAAAAGCRQDCLPSAS